MALPRLDIYPLLICALLACLAACSTPRELVERVITNIESSRAVAQDALASFHQDFNAGEFARILDGTDPGMYRVETRAQWEAKLKHLRVQVGPVRARRVLSHHSQHNVGSGQAIMLTCHTEYERGSAIETFRWRIVDATPRLQAYQVQRPEPVSPKSSPAVQHKEM